MNSFVWSEMPKLIFLIIACKCGGSTKHRLGVISKTPPYVKLIINQNKLSTPGAQKTIRSNFLYFTRCTFDFHSSLSCACSDCRSFSLCNLANMKEKAVLKIKCNLRV